jgi:sugar phosphate isomerase/epimerase
MQSNMQLKTFKTLWGNQLTIDQACKQAIDAGFSGIEGQAPDNRQQQLGMLSAIQNNGCDYIAEIVTGGDYVPDRSWSPQQHLDDMKRQLDNSMMLEPLFATSITGCDAWEESQSIDFFSQAIELADNYNITLSFETHRSRSLFTPWATRRIVEILPNMKLTADISHWCVVCERLMDTEMDTIEAIADRVHHIHGRVGYDQGPQVPDPAAPEYYEALLSHQRIWRMFWAKQTQRGYSVSTLTPEFGPDGYCHLQPYTQMPVADIWKINQWMSLTLQHDFQNFTEAQP